MLLRFRPCATVRLSNLTWTRRSVPSFSAATTCRRQFASYPPGFPKERFVSNDGYQRFQGHKEPFYVSKRLWVFLATGTVMFGGYYVAHLETVPISGRRRFMDVTKGQEEGIHWLSDYVVYQYLNSTRITYKSNGKTSIPSDHVTISAPHTATYASRYHVREACGKTDS